MHPAASVPSAIVNLITSGRKGSDSLSSDVETAADEAATQPCETLEVQQALVSEVGGMRDLQICQSCKWRSSLLLAAILLILVQLCACRLHCERLNQLYH